MQPAGVPPPEPTGGRTHLVGFGSTHPPLRGRDGPMARITAAVQALESGHSGVIVLHGPAGVGKTRLLDAALGAADQRGWRTLVAAAEPDAYLVPLAPVLDGVLAAFPPLVDPDELAALAANPNARYWLTQTIADGLEAVAVRDGLLVAVDDLQWCDTGSLAMLRSLRRRLSDLPVLWVFAVRSGGHSAAVRRTVEELTAVGETIEIEPLTDAATAEMVGDLLGARPDPGFSDALRRTDNLPLLVQELVQGLRDEKLITVRDRTASLTGPRMPDRFGSSIRERLGHLTAPTLQFVQAAAALGRTFSLPAAAELLDRPTGELIDAVTEAIASDLLVDGATLAFRHDAIREAAESMLTPSLRMHLRRRAADVRLRAGEPVLAVASSLADSAGAGDEPAIRLLTTAALELAETDAVSAGDLASRVVSLINGGDGFESTLTELVPVLWVGGRVDEARLLATRLRGSLDAEAEGRVGLTVARLELESSFVDALRTAERTLAVRGLPATIRSQLLAVKLLCAANVADHRRLAAVLGEARAAAVASADAIALSSVDATESALRFYQFRFREAQALIDDAVARMSGQSGFAMAQWLPEGLWPANLANSTGAIDTALAVVEANLAESRRTRSAVAMALWMMMRSRVLLDQGQLDEARLQAETVVDLADDLALGDITQVTAGMVLLRVALHQGDRAALERRLEAAEGLAGNLAMHRAGAWMLALAALHDGDLDTANEQATDAWTTLEDPLPSMTNPPDFADDVELARMAIRGGHPERLARIVAVARLRAEENPGNPLVAGILEHLEGLVGDSPARLGQAVALLRRTERPLLVAGALEDLGTALHRDLRAAGDGLDDSLPGSSSDAVAAWEEAAAVFDAAGAIRDAGRVRRSLREVGVIRRASTSAARDELSPRERQVVERLAAGSTTKQIASDLFLSPHTVVTHIRHVYAKWGVTSRKQLIERSRGLPEG